MATRKIRNNTLSDIHLVDFSDVGSLILKAEGDTGGGDFTTLLNEERTIKQSTQLFDLVSSGDVIVLDIDDVDILEPLLGWNWLVNEVASVEIVGVPHVIPGKPHASDGVVRTYTFSIDWTKRETWYNDAVYINNELLGIGNGSQKTFALDWGGTTAGYGITNGDSILNLNNGHVTDEQFLFGEDSIYYPLGYPGGYKVNVLVGTPTPTLKEERRSYDNKGGDFEVDYDNGLITFFTAPGSGELVLANYWIVPEDAVGTLITKPKPGKKIEIDSAEAQFSKNVIMNDTICQNIFVNDAPYFPMHVEYRRVGAFFDYTLGAFPIIPAFGGPVRGVSEDTLILRWDYSTPVELDSALGQELRAWLKDGVEFGGERATITFYAVESDSP